MEGNGGDPRPRGCRLQVTEYLDLVVEAARREQEPCAVCIRWECPLNRFVVAHFPSLVAREEMVTSG